MGKLVPSHKTQKQTQVPIDSPCRVATVRGPPGNVPMAHRLLETHHLMFLSSSQDDGLGKANMGYKPILATLEQSPCHQKSEGFQEGDLELGQVGSLTYMTHKNFGTCQRHKGLFRKAETHSGENAGLQKDRQQPLGVGVNVYRGMNAGAEPRWSQGASQSLVPVLFSSCTVPSCDLRRQGHGLCCGGGDLSWVAQVCMLCMSKVPGSFLPSKGSEDALHLRLILSFSVSPNSYPDLTSTFHRMDHLAFSWQGIECSF